MIPNPTSTTFFMLILGVLTFLFFMLLPSLIELKRPKDAGPRIVTENVAVMGFREKSLIPLVSIETEGFGLDKIIAKEVAEKIAFLPNLEA